MSCACLLDQACTKWFEIIVGFSNRKQLNKTAYGIWKGYSIQHVYSSFERFKAIYMEQISPNSFRAREFKQ
jgi:hypothetical protein